MGEPFMEVRFTQLCVIAIFEHKYMLMQRRVQGVVGYLIILSRNLLLSLSVKEF